MNLRDALSFRTLRSSSPYIRWVLLTMAVPMLVGVIAYRAASPKQDGTSVESASEAAVGETPGGTTAAPLAPPANVIIGTTIDYVIKRNDTLEQVFRRLNLNLNDLAAVRALPDVSRALDVLKPGDAISLTHIDGALLALRRRLSNTELLTVTRKDDTFNSEIINTPVDTKIVTAHGVVDSSLYVAARNAGLSADAIMRLANEIFGWDIDFALDIRRGDEFTLTYEQLYRDNEFLGDGRILAAEFINDSRLYRAVRYESTDGKIANYFTPEGRSMRKQFIRSPVDFTRISSGFSLARLHPILNTIRAHKGIDYAAPTGTPVKASGDGKVEFVGTRGGYGNAIILDHGAGITTLYGHLSRFAGIRNGGRVNQGQIIGYVGHTGAATGPHLHYEYRINGIYKDPRTVPLPNASPIPMTYLTEFHQQTDAMLESLDRARQAAVSIVAVEGTNKAR